MTSGCALTQGPREATSRNSGSSAARLALVDRIDPDEHAIGAEQLLAYLVREFLSIDGWLGIDPDGGEFFENAVKTVVLRRRGLPRFEIATPKKCHFKAFRLGHHCILQEGSLQIVGVISLIGQPPRNRRLSVRASVLRAGTWNASASETPWLGAAAGRPDAVSEVSVTAASRPARAVAEHCLMTERGIWGRP